MKRKDAVTFALILVALGIVEDITGALLVVGILTSLLGVGILFLKRRRR